MTCETSNIPCAECGHRAECQVPKAERAPCDGHQVCPACGTPWYVHDGPTRICQRVRGLEAEVARLREIIRAAAICHDYVGESCSACPFDLDCRDNMTPLTERLIEVYGQRETRP